MILRKMLRYFNIIFLLLLINFNVQALATDKAFGRWLENFKIEASQKGISQQTIDEILSDAKFLERVIVYDNRQPEFFEKTKLYISKRATKKAAKKAKIKYRENKKIFDEIEKKFKVEKEFLLALWSTETNYGNNFGKMDIVSSLATLSFDKRRSQFFTNELIILLSLVDQKILNKKMLYGSWAGALGNFQFMPSTILNHGIDYDGDNKIDLKYSMPDSIASAANYIRKLGWKYNHYCFAEVKFLNKVDKKYFNHSARKIKNKNNSKKWNDIGLVFLNNGNSIDLKGKTALILPDGDVNSPKYLTSENYEKILKWNRSLRFALSICTLAEMIKNEI